jgi:hypothetical protein
MCPLCMTSIALLATGGGTASGLAALVLTRFGSRRAGIQSGEFERTDDSSQATENATHGDNHD